MSGDFSIGSTVWPGTAKLLEEMGELQQVFGKLIATHGKTDHWDGTDLRQRMLEEAADVSAALAFFMSYNMTEEEMTVITVRAKHKLELFQQWQRDQK